jgi:hypothetical protein
MEKEKQLTTVEWFVMELRKLIKESELSDMRPSEFDAKEMMLIEQAKEMEKDMVIDFAKKFSDFNGLTFNEQKVSKEYLEKFYTNKISKTKKCDWCNKRKIIDNGYCIGKLESSKTDKEFFICVDCNLKHDIV